MSCVQCFKCYYYNELNYIKGGSIKVGDNLSNKNKKIYSIIKEKISFQLIFIYTM